MRNMYLWVFTCAWLYHWACLLQCKKRLLDHPGTAHRTRLGGINYDKDNENGPHNCIIEKLEKN